MKKLNTTHLRLTEVHNIWKKEVSHIVQAAANGQFPLWVVAERWEVTTRATTETLSGWVKLDVEDILPSIIKDQILIHKVSQAKGDTHHLSQFTLVEPKKVFFGAVYLESKVVFGADSAESTARPPEASKQSVEDEYLTTKEAAEYLKLKPNTLAKWRTNGKELRFTKAGSRIRYKKADLDEHLSLNKG